MLNPSDFWAGKQILVTGAGGFIGSHLVESRTAKTRIAPGLDPRLPPPGSDLVLRYQGKDVVVRVRQDGGFECNGRIYTCLSKAVTEATGTRWNGFAFCNLGHRPGVKHGERE